MTKDRDFFTIATMMSKQLGRAIYSTRSGSKSPNSARRKFFKILLFFCVAVVPVCAKKIEIFIDWHWDAKGQELFPVSENVSTEKLPLLSQVRKSLLDRGWDLFSWERDHYRPWLIGWDQVKSWEEFKWRLGWEVPELDGQGLWVFWGLGPKLKGFDLGRVPKEKLVLFMWEPPTVQKEIYDPKIQDQFGKIFTWDDDLVDNKRFFKFINPCMTPRIEQVVPFEEKKFCTLIGARKGSKHPKQLYKEREKTIRFFEDKPEEFDLYGLWWEKRHYKNWKGPIPDKIAVLKNYKFSIAYENMRDIKGYVSEKIFDCFAAGVVPVYWGASNITDYVPSHCFIDRRRFKSEQALYDFLKSVTVEQYNAYLEAAEQFLKSERVKIFTVEHFVKTFQQVIPK